jgi:hypothetical protein
VVRVEVQNEVMIGVARLITWVVIFDDRGWSWSVHHGGGGEGDMRLDPWTSTSLEDIEFTARVVVGPDEPVRGRSQNDAATAHWTYVAGLLREQGVSVTPHVLLELPHDVVVSDVLRAHIGRGGGTPSSGRVRAPVHWPRTAAW